MCGIAGVLSAKAPFDTGGERVLSCLKASLGHRGPDDDGTFISADCRAAFVHTRLAVLDLSAAGHQPMASADGRYWITFNGEIYNYRDLRRAMQLDGDAFRTNTDTEVLLRLYAREGPDCVAKLQGMFAFAIWDSAAGTCFLARDLFGIKPLYYQATANRLVFASEIRALLKSGLVQRRLSPDGVAGYFGHGSVPEPDTLVRDVYCLRAGEALLWQNGHTRQWQHSELKFTGESTVDAKTAAEGVRAALEDSIERHFVSDVAVGLFLSGGVDSTALLALAAQVRDRKINTFCIRVADREFDEGVLAQRTAAHFGSNHAEWSVDAKAGHELFQSFVDCIDQPTIDGFNTFIASKFAHDQGMKVVLSGLGGDELFGGYPSFRRVPAMVRIGGAFRGIRPVTRLVGGVLEALAPKAPWRRLGQFMQTTPDVVAAYLAYRGIFLAAEAERMAIGYAGPVPPVSGETGSPIEPQPSQGDELSALELSLYMRNQLLRDSDVMSMAWGLELRTPFLDRALFQTLAGIPSTLRLRRGKKHLLEAVPEIPDWIKAQPKRGFVVPFERWFAGERDDMFKRVEGKFGVRCRTWYQRWSVFVFEHWCQEHGLG